MKKIALIFDCDGTLVDSYDAISDRLYRIFLNHGYSFEINEIKEKLLMHDTNYFVHYACDKCGLVFEDIIQELKNTKENYSLIRLMPHTIDLLMACKEKDIDCYVYTHRGESVLHVFDMLKIQDYFKEIINSTAGYKRKPSAEAIKYLISKYQLDKENTYYVGDRELDIECGKNANIQTIFLKSSGVDINYQQADIVVDDLNEIIDKLSLKQ